VTDDNDSTPEISLPEAEGEAPVKKKSVIDIDAKISEKMAAAQTDAMVIQETVSVLGREWDLVNPSNDFNNLRAANFQDNPDALIQLMLDLVHPDQRQDFFKTMKSTIAMPTEILLEIFTAMTEAVGDRPTKRSSPSRRGRVTPRSSKSSTAS
jgi:hypothetical protein